MNPSAFRSGGIGSSRLPEPDTHGNLEEDRLLGVISRDQEAAGVTMKNFESFRGSGQQDREYSESGSDWESVGVVTPSNSTLLKPMHSMTDVSPKIRPDEVLPDGASSLVDTSAAVDDICKCDVPCELNFLKKSRLLARSVKIESQLLVRDLLPRCGTLNHTLSENGLGERSGSMISSIFDYFDSVFGISNQYMLSKFSWTRCQRRLFFETLGQIVDDTFLERMRLIDSADVASVASFLYDKVLECLLVRLLSEFGSQSMCSDSSFPKEKSIEGKACADLLRFVTMLGAYSFSVGALKIFFEHFLEWRNASEVNRIRGLVAINLMRSFESVASSSRSPRSFFLLSQKGSCAFIPCLLNEQGAPNVSSSASASCNEFTFAMWFRLIRPEGERCSLFCCRNISSGSSFEVFVDTVLDSNGEVSKGVLHLCSGVEPHELSLAHVNSVELGPDWHWIGISVELTADKYSRIVVIVDGVVQSISSALLFPACIGDVHKTEFCCAVGASFTGREQDGKLANVTNWFSGHISHAAFFRKALSALDLLQLYEQNARDSGCGAFALRIVSDARIRYGGSGSQTACPTSEHSNSKDLLSGLANLDTGVMFDSAQKVYRFSRRRIEIGDRQRFSEGWGSLPRAIASNIIFSLDVTKTYFLEEGTSVVCYDQRKDPVSKFYGVSKNGSKCPVHVVERSSLSNSLASVGGIERMLPMLLECIHVHDGDNCEGKRAMKHDKGNGSGSKSDLNLTSSRCNENAAMMARIIAFFSDIVTLGTSENQQRQQLGRSDSPNNGIPLVELVHSVLLRCCPYAVSKEVVSAVASLADSALFRAYSLGEPKNREPETAFPETGNCSKTVAVVSSDSELSPRFVSLSDRLSPRSKILSPGSFKDELKVKVCNSFESKFAAACIELLFDLGIWCTAPIDSQKAVFKELELIVLEYSFAVHCFIGVEDLLDSLLFAFWDQNEWSPDSPLTRLSCERLRRRPMELCFCSSDIRWCRLCLLNLVDMLVVGDFGHEALAPYLTDIRCVNMETVEHATFNNYFFGSSRQVGLSGIMQVVKFCRSQASNTNLILDVLQWMVSLVSRIDIVPGLSYFLHTNGDLMELWPLLQTTNADVVCLIIRLIHAYSLRNMETLSSGNEGNTKEGENTDRNRRIRFGIAHAKLISHYLTQKDACRPNKQIIDALFDFAIGRPIDHSGFLMETVGEHSDSIGIRFPAVIQIIFDYTASPRATTVLQKVMLERLASIFYALKSSDAANCSVLCFSLTKYIVWPTWFSRLACQGFDANDALNTAHDFSVVEASRELACDIFFGLLSSCVIGAKCNSDNSTVRRSEVREELPVQPSLLDNTAQTTPSLLDSFEASTSHLLSGIRTTRERYFNSVTPSVKRFSLESKLKQSPNELETLLSSSGRSKTYPNLSNEDSGDEVTKARIDDVLIHSMDARKKQLFRAMACLDLELEASNRSVVRSVRLGLFENLLEEAIVLAREANSGIESSLALLCSVEEDLRDLCQFAMGEIVCSDRSLAGALTRRAKSFTSEMELDFKNSMGSLSSSVVLFWSLFSEVVLNRKNSSSTLRSSSTERGSRLHQYGETLRNQERWVGLLQYKSNMTKRFLTESKTVNINSEKKPTVPENCSVPADLNSYSARRHHMMSSHSDANMSSLADRGDCLNRRSSPDFNDVSRRNVEWVLPNVDMDLLLESPPAPRGGLVWQVVDVVVCSLDGIFSQIEENRSDIVQHLSYLELLLQSNELLTLAPNRVDSVMDKACKSLEIDMSPSPDSPGHDNSIDFRPVSRSMDDRKSSALLVGKPETDSPVFVPASSCFSSPGPELILPPLSSTQPIDANVVDAPTSGSSHRPSLGGFEAFIIVDEPHIPLTEPDVERLLLLVLLLGEWIGDCGDYVKAKHTSLEIDIMSRIVVRIGAELIASECHVDRAILDMCCRFWLSRSANQLNFETFILKKRGIQPNYVNETDLFCLPNWGRLDSSVAQLVDKSWEYQKLYEESLSLYSDLRATKYRDELKLWEARCNEQVNKSLKQLRNFDGTKREEVARISTKMRIELDRGAESFRKWKLLLRNFSVFPISSFTCMDESTADGIRNACFWKVDRRENSIRMRLRLKRSFGTCVAMSKSGSEKGTCIEQKKCGSSGESGGSMVNGLLEAKVSGQIATLNASELTSFTSGEMPVIEGLEDSENIHGVSAPSPDWDLIELASVHYAARNEHVVYSTECELVLPMYVIEGRIDITHKHLYFYGDSASPPGLCMEELGHSFCSDKKDDTAVSNDFSAFSADDKQPFSLLWRVQSSEVKLKLRLRTWSLCDLCDIQSRRYLLRRSAMELFFVNRRSFLFDFRSVKEARTVLDWILRQNPPFLLDSSCYVPRTPNPASFVGSASGASGALHRLVSVGGHGTVAAFSFLKQMVSARLEIFTRKWVNWEMSTFEYLMCLNTAAGRTYNDLAQYPVFPWVIQDYSSPMIDLDDDSVYRDLSKPMGALEPKRLARFKLRKQNLESPLGIGSSQLGERPFLYGSHYSSVGTVLYFLLRVEPFASYVKEMQGGRMDHADRLFHSVEETWNHCLNSDNDLKELTPEWFFFPDIFCNKNGLNLGRRQDGTMLGDVVLPSWANGCSSTFTRLNMEALEGRIASSQMHSWIDLIFGSKQRGLAAEEADNLFHHLTYEDAVDIDAVKDPVLKHSIIAQIANFGQTPAQLFLSPHPKRKPMPSILSATEPSSIANIWLAKSWSCEASLDPQMERFLSCSKAESYLGSTNSSLGLCSLLQATGNTSILPTTSAPLRLLFLPCGDGSQAVLRKELLECMTNRIESMNKYVPEQLERPSEDEYSINLIGLKRTKETHFSELKFAVLREPQFKIVSIRRIGGKQSGVQLDIGKTQNLQCKIPTNSVADVFRDFVLQIAQHRRFSSKETVEANLMYLRDCIYRAKTSCLLANGTALATCGDVDHAVKIHSLLNGRLLQCVTPFRCSCASVCLASDESGTALCIGCQDGSLYLWRLSPPSEAEASVRDLAVSLSEQTEKQLNVDLGNPTTGDEGIACSNSTEDSIAHQQEASMTSIVMKFWSAFRPKKTEQAPIVLTSDGPRHWFAGFHTAPITCIFINSDLDIVGSSSILNCVIILHTCSDGRFLRSIDLPNDSRYMYSTIVSMRTCNLGRIVVHRNFFGADNLGILSKLHVVDVNGNLWKTRTMSETVLDVQMFGSRRYVLVAMIRTVHIYETEALEEVCLVTGSHQLDDKNATICSVELSGDQLSVAVAYSNGIVSWHYVGEGFIGRTQMY